MNRKSQSEVPYARTPKQARSRASFERVLDAAAALLEERGYAGLTIGELSERAQVSVGSIYGRVANKDDLLRALQVRVFEQLDTEFGSMINRIRRRALPLRDLVPFSVKEYAIHLRRHAGILRAFMEAGQMDTVVRSRGSQAYHVVAADFRQVILDRRDEISHPDPEKAVATVFSILYASLSRYLGLGTAKEMMGEGDWDTLVRDLGLVALSYLLFDTRKIAHEGKGRSSTR